MKKKKHIKCPMCHTDFLPEDATYDIRDKVKYCSKICLREEQLIQEEEALNRLQWEANRYAN
tara:strand:- start:6212 stop:6397 length:186 start_codon:yes stop_codon:yes gene_type:complete